MENTARMKGFFYRIGDEENDTIIAIENSCTLIPPTIIELSGYTKNAFVRDWELNEYENKK